MIRLLALLFLAGCGGRVHPHQDTEAAVDCGRGAGFDYCIYTAAATNGRRSTDLLYFLHGGGEAAESWGRWAVGKEYFREYRSKGIPAPTVVSISFGRLWLLTEKSGLFERFTSVAMPFIEKKTRAPAKRFLWGMSMGGFNALELALKRPELWRAVVLSCPGITPLSPRAAPQEIKDYMARTGARKANVDSILDLARTYFPNGEDWDRHDPLALAAAAGSIPPLLIECGDQDEYGFFEGSRLLSEALGNGGRSVEFHRVPGGAHCVVTPAVVLKFLQAAD